MTGRPLPDEFALIARCFAPLAETSPGAARLADDAALLDLPAGESLVVTTDTIVSGVHFLADDPADLVARKLLRVNLSDLAGKRARPVGYLLNCAFPSDLSEDWIAEFTRGLAWDQQEYSIGLMGGDTTGTPGALTLTVTALGAVKQGQMLRRGGARDGDLVLVSGTVGDGALGLDVLKGHAAGLTDDQREHLIQRYRLPQPRLSLGMALAAAGIGHASMDVSDGLAADLGHICQASGVGAVIEWGKVPLSVAARAAVSARLALPERILTGGDDYEILMTLPASQLSRARKEAHKVGVPLTVVGTIVGGKGVRVLDGSGRAMKLGKTGFRHFQ